MALTVTCPDCDKKLKLKDEMAGKKVRCPGCSSIISVPKPSIESGDDFLSDLDEPAPPKRKKRASDDDYEEYDDEPPVKSPRSRKPEKKKQKRGKSSRTNWGLIAGLAGGGLIALLFVAMLIAAIGQARKAAANRQLAVWPTFRHPTGFAQVDMPGTPIFNAAESKNGAQTFSLKERNHQFSLTGLPLQGPVKIAVATNPGAVDIMFTEMKKAVPLQSPGARLISSRELVGGIKGLEMKVDIKGTISIARFYVFPDVLVACEFLTRNESADSADRERFFNSVRGPDGNLINGPPQPPAGAPAGNAHAAIAPATP